MRTQVMPSKTNFTKSVIAAFIGVIVIILGVYFWVSEKNYEKDCTEKVTGVVLYVDSKYISGKNSHTEYIPCVGYLYNDKEYEYSVRKPFRSNYFSEGETVDMMFDPSQTAKCYLVKEGETLLGRTWYFFVLGISLIIVGGFGAFAFRERY